MKKTPSPKANGPVKKKSTAKKAVKKTATSVGRTSLKKVAAESTSSKKAAPKKGSAPASRDTKKQTPPASASKAKPIGREAENTVAAVSASGNGERNNPWVLKTPSGQSEYTAYRDESSLPPALVVTVGKTELRYDIRCLGDLHAMLKSHADWMPLGSTDEQKPAADGTVEAWARSASNPVKGWYGLKKGLRGRFANYVPPVMEVLGLAEVEHMPKNNRMRAK